MGRGKSKASAKELTLDEKVAANREALKKAQDEFYKLPSDVDDETFKRVNGKLNQLQEEQYNLEKEQKKAEREEDFKQTLQKVFGEKFANISDFLTDITKLIKEE